MCFSLSFFSLFSLVILGQVFYCGSGDMCVFFLFFFISCVLCVHKQLNVYTHIYSVYMY